MKFNSNNKKMWWKKESFIQNNLHISIILIFQRKLNENSNFNEKQFYEFEKKNRYLEETNDCHRQQKNDQKNKKKNKKFHYFNENKIIIRNLIYNFYIKNYFFWKQHIIQIIWK